MSLACTRRNPLDLVSVMTYLCLQLSFWRSASLPIAGQRYRVVVGICCVSQCSLQ